MSMISSLGGVIFFGVPQMLLFHIVWSIHMLIRPLVVLTALAALTNPKAAVTKLQMTIRTIQFLMFSKDKKWKKTSTPDTLPATAELQAQKTVIFLRHGESTWNDTFNKGSHRGKLQFILGFLPNLGFAMFMEWYFFVTGQASESWFYDAPLSNLGIAQAKGVQNYLNTTKAEFLPPQERRLFEILKGNISTNDSDNGSTPLSKTLLVTSTLRRAISTLLIGLQDTTLMASSQQATLLLPCLQEISINPDALCITPAGGPIVASWTDPPFLNNLYHNKVDCQTHHTGNKPLNSNGSVRLHAFCELIFNNQNSNVDAVVAAGHSLYFKSFFQTYLPASTEHIAKKKKLINGGLAGFTLEEWKVDNKKTIYRIDPKSIVVLHGGF